MAVWYMMWDNIGRIEENRSSMDIMPREWRSDGDAGSSTSSSREVQFDKKVSFAQVYTYHFVMFWARWLD